MPSFIRFAAALAALCVCFAVGCAPSTVRLVYNPSGEAVTPAVSAVRIAVLPLADARGTAAVGVRKDGTEFLPSSPVAAWLTHTLEGELARKGYAVVRAASEEEAERAGIRYILSGTIEEVRLVETSATDYSCTTRMAVVLRDGKKTILRSAYNGNLSRRVVPLSSVPEEMLSESGRDLALSVVGGVASKVSPR